MRGNSGAGLGLALLSAAAFGTSGPLAAGLLAAGWSPGAAVTARVVLAAAALTVPALLALRGRASLLRRHARRLTVFGVVGVAGAQLCYFNAVERLPVAIALLLEYSGVLLVVGWLWVRHGQRPSAATTAGALVALLGLALVLDLTSAAAAASGGGVDLVGVAWALGAAVGLASYFVLAADVGEADAGGAGQGGVNQGGALPPLALAWAGLGVGGAALVLLGAIGVLPLAASRASVELAGAEVSWVVPVLWLGLVAAALAYATGVLGARLLGARQASFVALSEVLFAVVFAWVLLGQGLAAVQVAGGALVVAGVALVRAGDRGSPTSGRSDREVAQSAS